MIGRLSLHVANVEKLGYLSAKNFCRLEDAVIAAGITNWKNVRDAVYWSVQMTLKMDYAHLVYPMLIKRKVI